jgi:hypothetical protein
MDERRRPRPPAFIRLILPLLLMGLYLPLVTMVIGSFFDITGDSSVLSLRFFGNPWVGASLLRRRRRFVRPCSGFSGHSRSTNGSSWANGRCARSHLSP